MHRAAPRYEWSEKKLNYHLVGFWGFRVGFFDGFLVGFLFVDLDFTGGNDGDFVIGLIGLEGVAVGFITGRSDGFPDGFVVGNLVVGWDDGFMVGFKVGLKVVGFNVGENVGFLVGLNVGNSVGSVVFYYCY